MAEIYVVKPVKKYNDYGELIEGNLFEVTFYNSRSNHYPNSSKKTIEDLTPQYKAGFEGINHLEIAWIEQCCACDIDISEGYFAYLANKYWKIVGTRVYDNCGCTIIRLTLNRLEPRETHKQLVECVSCFDKVGYLQRCGA